MNSPRDYNQPPWPPRQNPGPNPGLGSQPTQQGPPPQGYPPQGHPPQGEIPWYQQPVKRSVPPPTQQRPPSPYPPAGQYPPPGQYGPPGVQPPAAKPAPTLPKKPSKSKAKPLLIGGAVVVVLIVGVVAALMMSGAVSLDTKKVAVGGVQTEVQQILVDRVTGYSSDDIKDVKCNNGQDPTVEKGGSFACDVSVRGKQRKLTVTFLNDDGLYEVGLPELVGGK